MSALSEAAGNRPSVADDIITGNVSGAATVEWADTHVAKRSTESLDDVLDEWEVTGPQIDEVVAAVGLSMPYQFYIDLWTHEWDIRQAIPTPPSRPDLTMLAPTLEPLLESRSNALAGAKLPPVALRFVGWPTGDIERTIGASSAASVDPTGQADAKSVEMTVPAFEFYRLTMGRRSPAQVAALCGSDAPEWVEALVAWSPSPIDIVDPVVADSAR